MASRSVQVNQGQTVFDITVQEYGDIHQLQGFLDLNGYDINKSLKAGDSVLVDTDDIGDSKVKGFFNRLLPSGKKRYTSANYTEYLARDFALNHFNEDDFS